MSASHPPSQTTPEKALLQRMFQAAIEAAQPSRTLASFLPTAPRGRLLVIGAGKASAEMARALEEAWPGRLEGLVVTRYGYAVPCQRIEILEAAHPVPDQAGHEAAQRVLKAVQGLKAHDTVLCLISGGGSALLPLPLDGITLAEKQQVNRELLRCGASISEMNTVRRHLSAIKGGRLAAACYPARVVNLLISDVPGDDPRDIASGPTVADASTCADALAIVKRYGITLPPSVQRVLASGAGESIKPSDPRLARVVTHMIATPQKALQAAAQVAREAGMNAYILSDRIEGEAREVGKVMAALALQAAQNDTVFQTPCVLLSGGETTVTLKGKGRGGRNVEFLLALAIALRSHARIHALAGDTDGVDGQEEVAGAVVSPDTLQRAWALGIRPQESLDNNDGHGFFEALGDAVVTGPTLTNVNDFRAILLTA